MHCGTVLQGAALVKSPFLSDGAAQKTFSQIGVSLCLWLDKKVSEIKVFVPRPQQKVNVYKTGALEHNGTLIELRDLKDAAQGRLIFLFLGAQIKKLPFLFCFPMHVFGFPKIQKPVEFA